MWRRSASTDRLPSNRSEVSHQSPYAKNYRTNLTHDQREQLSHRQNISRFPRRELEDRYIALVDEHYALKKENAANNEKIKKMATKLLRLSAEGKTRGTPFPLQLSPNENLEIQIIRLEAYNAMLKDRLNTIIRRYSSFNQSGSMSALRRPVSCSNLSIKRKIILSQDDLNLLEIPEPPVITNKTDNRSICGSTSAVMSPDKKHGLPKSGCKLHQNYLQSQSSTIFEIDNASNLPDTGQTVSIDEKSSMNDLKNTIEKLENELSDAKESNDSIKRLNVALEEKLTDELVSKRITENVELIELRRTMAECETELHELRQNYVILKSKAESELDEQQRKIEDLTRIVSHEMNENKSLSNQLKALKHVTDEFESQQYDRSDTQQESELNRSIRAKVEEVEKLSESIEKIEGKEAMTKSDDLVVLLNDAKSTIIQLQSDADTLKSHVESLRKQNEEYEKTVQKLKNGAPDIQFTQSRCTKMSQTEDIKAPPIPLEPIVIVNKTAEHKKRKHNDKRNQLAANPKKMLNIDTNSITTDDSQSTIGDRCSDSDDDTYVVSKEPLSEQDVNKYNQMANNNMRNSNEATDTEVSSLDSDENFRLFHSKNKELQNSLLLSDAQQAASMSFAQRFTLLERAAYYRPLVNVAINPNSTHDDHFLECNCTGFECDQQNQDFYEEIRRAVKNAKSLLLKEIKENGYYSSRSGGGDDSKISGRYFDDSSECREFLRVQYNLNNLYKQELELVCKTCKVQTQTLLKEIDSLKQQLQSHQDQLKAAELNNNAIFQANEEQSARILEIGRDEGSFEFHINNFRLTKEGKALLSCKHGELGFLFVSWAFFNCAIESKTAVRSPPNYSFHSSHIYAVSINEMFLRRVQDEKLSIKLMASIGATVRVVGKADINLSEVLIFPHNKIQLTAKILSVCGECEQRSQPFERFCDCNDATVKSKHLGNLAIWFRLTCELDVLRSFASKNWFSQQPQLNGQTQLKENESSEQSPTEKHRTRKSHRKDIKEISQISESDPNAPTSPNSRSSTSITVVRMKLNSAAINETDGIKQICIEYSFLGHRKLRTKSQPFANSEVVFNFHRTFTIDSNDDRNYHRLNNLLKDTERSIKLTVVNTTPQEIADDGDTSLGNTEIGFGLLHLGKLVRNWFGNIDNTVHTIEIPILSKKPPYQNIGHLEVNIEGIPLLKRIQQMSNDESQK